MKVSINGVDVEMRCSNCFHWAGDREQPDGVGPCLGGLPTPILTFAPMTDIVGAEVREEEVIKSVWPSTQGGRRCGVFMPFQMPAAVPGGVTRQ